MNNIEKIAYQLKILTFTNKKIKRWIKSKKFDKVAYASKKGNYKIRLFLLSEIKEISNQPVPFKIASELINDKVQLVSEKSIEIIKTHISDSNTDLLKQIKDKQQYWSEQEKIHTSKKSSSPYHQTWKKNKDAMVRLKQVKKQLKKSMYGERWM